MLEPAPTPIAPLVEDLGRMPYAEAFEHQQRRQREVIEARGAADRSYLLLVEHDPAVVTISRRPSAHRHLLADATRLAAEGVEVVETNRGGDITYHGPGQLVAYPILDLNRLHLRLHGYMRFLEQAVIDTLAAFGVEGVRDDEATGVWVPGSTSAKICAMGVRVSRWVSMHGLALNVTTNLEHFDLIVPCGLPGRTVTSMRRELGDACPEMDAVKTELARQVGRHAEAASRRSATT